MVKPIYKEVYVKKTNGVQTTCFYKYMNTLFKKEILMRAKFKMLHDVPNKSYRMFFL